MTRRTSRRSRRLRKVAKSRRPSRRASRRSGGARRSIFTSKSRKAKLQMLIGGNPWTCKYTPGADSDGAGAKWVCTGASGPGQQESDRKKADLTNWGILVADEVDAVASFRGASIASISKARKAVQKAIDDQRPPADVTEAAVRALDDGSVTEEHIRAARAAADAAWKAKTYLPGVVASGVDASYA